MAPEGTGEGTDDGDGVRPRRQYQAVKLPREVRQRLRIGAAFLDVEISELVEDAVVAHLDQIDADRRARGQRPLPQPDEAPGGSG